MPVVVPAPLRFSTTTAWPSCAPTCWNTIRAMRSAVLPGVVGAMTLIGCAVGHSCVAATFAASDHAINTIAIQQAVRPHETDAIKSASPVQTLSLRPACRHELRQGRNPFDILVHHLNRHVANDLVRRNADDVADHTGSFFQLDQRYGVGDFVGEAGMINAMVDDVGEDLSASTHRRPAKVGREAVGALGGGRKPVLT